LATRQERRRSFGDAMAPIAERAAGRQKYNEWHARL
jgi:hypothetical protein